MNIPLISQEQNSSLNIKLYILDPLSIIIKLAILAKKPVGTKIIIKSNTVQFQDPGVFQFAFRYWNNSTKMDLHFLYNPIKIACSVFLNDTDKTDPRIKTLFETAQTGLKNLIETYRTSSLVNVCLNYYYSIITNYIEGKNNQNLFHKDQMTSLYTDDLTNKLMGIWSPERIKIILDLIDFLSSDNSATCNVCAIETIMQQIEYDTQMIISNI